MTEDIVKNLEKGKYLLEHIHQEKYTDKTIAPYYSSIGSHIRHVLDMFNCVFIGCESSIVNFTKRERNCNVENYISYGLDYFDSIINKLNKLTAADLDKELKIVDDLGSGLCSVKSTLGAVLAQSHIHAIHHYASIGYMLHNLEVCLPTDSFGINPTTPQKVYADK
ncbi:hypothetical protein FHR24_001967 [Wenyingzhuangia heitensis]|uniref:DinB family protein n=1 Tax=Wenyingzhuangia heitensis TaxID=1487859 RepID=A0ABX0U9I6_9FLAO|nr:DinB family protein [Wenyingzhuangia heitensis]NIJ45499.1 hypothetical protein [Wenyingzhuangia heitensis]